MLQDVKIHCGIRSQTAEKNAAACQDLQEAPSQLERGAHPEAVANVALEIMENS